MTFGFKPIWVILWTPNSLHLIKHAKLVVISFSGDHTEVIEIDYDPENIKYEQLLKLFWNNHEYGLTTQIKKQYASIIFYHNEEQKKIAEGKLGWPAKEVFKFLLIF